MQLDIKKIADKADMIINGYAFTKEEGSIRILNLNCLNHAAVIYDDQIAETNMDDIIMNSRYVGITSITLQAVS